MGISEVISNGITYLLTMSISDIVDVLLVAALIYGCIGLIRRTNAIRLARGIVFVLLVLVVSDLLNLKMISSLFQRIVELGLIAIFIIFQPEIRRLLERMGSGKFAYFFGADRPGDDGGGNQPDRAGLCQHVRVQDRRPDSL